MKSENKVRADAWSLIERYPVHAAAVALAVATDLEMHGKQAAADDAKRVVEAVREMMKTDQGGRLEASWTDGLRTKSSGLLRAA